MKRSVLSHLMIFAALFGTPVATMLVVRPFQAEANVLVGVGVGFAACVVAAFVFALVGWISRELPELLLAGPRVYFGAGLLLLAIAFGISIHTRAKSGAAQETLERQAATYCDDLRARIETGEAADVASYALIDRIRTDLPASDYLHEVAIARQLRSDCYRVTGWIGFHATEERTEQGPEGTDE